MDILIADDHKLFSDMLGMALKAYMPDANLHSAQTIDEAVRKIKDMEIKPVLIMVDYVIPGMKGDETLAEIMALAPHSRLVLVSGMIEETAIEQAKEQGAKGYLPKTLPLKKMIEGIVSILNGEPYFPKTIAGESYLPSYHGDKDNDPQRSSADYPPLTTREMDVLSYLVQGASNKVIARELGIQEVTVKLHMRGVCQKLSADNRTQAAMIAVRDNLIHEMNS